MVGFKLRVVLTLESRMYALSLEEDPTTVIHRFGAMFKICGPKCNWVFKEVGSVPGLLSLTGAMVWRVLLVGKRSRCKLLM